MPLPTRPGPPAARPGPAARPPRARQRKASDNRFKWTRRVKRGWQARVWLGSGVLEGSLHLRWFSEAAHGADAEWMAARVSREFAKCYRPGQPGALRTAFERMQALGHVAPSRLPPHVRRAGGGFVGRATLHGRRFETAPRDCPWAAHAALREAVEAAIAAALPVAPERCRDWLKRRGWEASANAGGARGGANGPPAGSQRPKRGKTRPARA